MKPIPKARAAPDLARLGVFLQAVTSGHDPAEGLATLRLARVTILEIRGSRGPGSRVVMTLVLEYAP
jgi:hypothetical protein